MKHRWKWIVAVALFAMAGLAFWAWQGGSARAVRIGEARTGPAAELVYATGFIEAQQPVSVSSRITAPVDRILVEEGDRVKRGQPLVLLIDDEQRGLLAQAAAQRRAAEIREGRTLTLTREGWMTRAARDQAVADADAARAGEATARARLDQLVVRANIDGVVIKRDVYPGDLATPSKVLIQLGDPAKLRITATIDERDIARVHLGQAALMSSDAWPGRTIRARVSEITPSGDPGARAFRVRLAPEAANNLPLGLTLEVNIVAQSRQKAVLVPASAVAAGHVWVVRDGRVTHRAIKTGISAANTIEITAGLGSGEKVVLDPPADLAEGQRVKATAP